MENFFNRGVTYIYKGYLIDKDNFRTEMGPIIYTRIIQ